MTVNLVAISRNKRRQLVHLAYSVCAKEVPHCQIMQDDLRRRYPDTNYGLTVTTTTTTQAKHLSECLDEAFQRRGFSIYSNQVQGSEVRVSGFYQNVRPRP